MLIYDALEYHNLALSLISGQSFSTDFRTILYPGFIGLTYFLFGVKPWLVIFLQIIIGGLSIVILYSAIQKILSEKTALFSALLLCIDPLLIMHSNQLHTEVLFISICLVAFYFLCVFFSSQTSLVRYIALSGLFFGLATNIRPIALYIFIPVLLSAL